MAALVTLCFTGLSMAANVIDRIAVVVGNRAVKTSDIDRGLRVTEFLNGEPLNLSSPAKHKAAERLIDQTLIRGEMERIGYIHSTTSGSEEMLNRLRQDRFGGSDARLRESLSRYGVTEDTLRMQMQWQLKVLDFIDQRFSPGVVITDNEVKTYYDQHQAELRRTWPQLRTFEALTPAIRQLLQGQRLNQDFEQWLADERQRTRIVYHEEAFA